MKVLVIISSFTFEMKPLRYEKIYISILIIFICFGFVETYINPSLPDRERTEKINLNFHFYTVLWCLKRFYEDPKGLHKIV